MRGNYALLNYGFRRIVLCLVQFCHWIIPNNALLSGMDDEVEGFRVVAQSLSKLGVKYMFGVVGIPVVEVKIE